MSVEHREVFRRKLPENIPAFMYGVKEDGRYALGVEVRFDSFLIAWPTEIPFNSFLPYASQFLDSLSTLKLPGRDFPSLDPTKVITVKLDEEGKAEGSSMIAPSYSGFGINNVIAGGCPEIPFSELTWPLNFNNIRQTAFEKGYDYFIDPDSPENESIRVNGEYCTLIYHGEPRHTVLWSHVLPLQETWNIYSSMTPQPMPQKEFWNISTTLIEKHNNPNLVIL